MKFEFEVGKDEKHRVAFSFDQFWGTVLIRIDGKTIKRTLHVFSFSLSKKFRFPVGTVEKHEVVVEKIRKLLFAGLRDSTDKVYIDGRLDSQFVG